MTIQEIILRISKIRQRANISARALSLQIGKNDSYINMLESKGFELSLGALFEILEVCDCSPEEFFYSSLEDYQTDKACLHFIQTLSPQQKNAIQNLYKK